MLTGWIVTANICVRSWTRTFIYRCLRAVINDTTLQPRAAGEYKRAELSLWPLVAERARHHSPGSECWSDTSVWNFPPSALPNAQTNPGSGSFSSSQSLRPELGSEAPEGNNNYIHKNITTVYSEPGKRGIKRLVGELFWICASHWLTIWHINPRLHHT